MLPGGDYKETAQQAVELVKKGFNPVPHFPARSIHNEKELKDYRKQVAEEFTTTAEKFRELNQSYSALHKQLSSSANLLCDDVDITLLNPPADEEYDADFIEVQPSGTNQR